MKTFTRVMLILSAALLVVGLAIGFAGFASGASWSVYIDRQGVHTLGEREQSELKIEMPDIKRVELRLRTTNLELSTGESFRYEAHCVSGALPEYRVEEGVLYIEELGGREDFGIFGIYMGAWGNSIKLCLPETMPLERVDISATTGDISVRGLRLEKLCATGTTGSIRLQEIWVDEFKGTLTTGDWWLENIEAKQLSLVQTTGSTHGDGLSWTSAEFTTHTGDIRLTHCDSDGLTAQATTGSLSVQGALRGENRLDTSTGDIQFESELPREAYRVQLESNTGDVYEWPVGEADADAPNSLIARASTGSIRACFAQD